MLMMWRRSHCMPAKKELAEKELEEKKWQLSFMFLLQRQKCKSTVQQQMALQQRAHQHQCYWISLTTSIQNVLPLAAEKRQSSWMHFMKKKRNMMRSRQPVINGPWISLNIRMQMWQMKIVQALWGQQWTNLELKWRLIPFKRWKGRIGKQYQNLDQLERLEMKNLKLLRMLFFLTNQSARSMVILRKKVSDMHTMLENTFKYMKTAMCIVKIWSKIWRNKAKFLQVEQVQELRQQMWMMFSNLNDWFDAWEMFCLDHGFAEEGDQMNNSDKMELLLADEQKHCIINVDGTNSV